jgi:tRNA A37 threonylcarbamoyladenosine modification protein TsaB
MHLYLNTSNLREVEFKLFDGQKQAATYTAVLDPYATHEVLAHLDAFLTKEKVSLDTLKAVLLYTGEGSHTGLRIGLAIAQGLSLATGMSVKTTTEKK